MKPDTFLKSFQLKNFKAVRDSKTIKFTPLTAFIGNNGSGKSSIVEALEMLKTMSLYGIDEAMIPWHGFEHIWNKAVSHELSQKNKDKTRLPNPMGFSLKGMSNNKKVNLDFELSLESTKNKLVVKENKKEPLKLIKFPSGQTESLFDKWQFLKLTPSSMTEPRMQKRTYGESILNSDGSNIAEYLQSIYDKDTQAFDSIIDTLKVVLPYAVDFKTKITSELDKKLYLSLSEKSIAEDLPGWLLSTGTLRILALLSVLRHPEPPSLIVIEEIENGLDPRTIHLLVEEMRSFVEDGLGQIIITTHSPYLLDLLPLSSIITVERNSNGAPVFNRPSDKKEMSQWTKTFTPGKLYTMGTLTGGNQ